MIFQRAKWWVLLLAVVLVAGCSRPAAKAPASEEKAEAASGEAVSADPPKQEAGSGEQAAAASGTAAAPELDQTFDDPQGRMSLKAPAGWLAYGYEGAVVALVSPQNGVDDFFLENVLVTADAQFEDLTFPRYMKALEAEVRKRYPDTQQVETGEIEVDGQTAHFLVESFTSDKGPAKVYRVVIIRETTAYVLHATAPVQTFDRYRPIFEAMARSITFPKPQP